MGNSFQTFRLILRQALVALAIGIFGISAMFTPARATAGVVETWEYSPYRIQVWLAIEDTPDLSPNVRREIQRILLERTELVFGGAWQLTVSPPPAPFATEMIYRLESVPVADLVELAKLGKIAAPKKQPVSSPDSGTAADAKPAEAKPAEAKSAEAESSAAKPADAQPADGKPADAPKDSAAESVPEVDPVTVQLRQAFASEKVIVVSVTRQFDHWRIQSRELDCRARVWGPLLEITVRDPALLASEATSAAHGVFAPVARTESVQESKTAVLRLRAAGLARNDESPILVGRESIIQPYVRYNDRYGEPKAGGVQTLPWTTLVVTERNGSGLNCDIHSGGRVALSGKTSSRIDRFSIVQRRTFESTKLRLRTLDKNPQPLSGYDIYAKDPRSEDTVLIGRTDWQGTMEIPPTDYPLRLVYVKNGGSLLARLPIAPGVQPTLQVDLQSDDKRLQAEGFLLGVQGALTDLVAQRELTIKRLRNKLVEANTAEAEKLLTEFKALPTRDDLQKLIDQNQPRIRSPQPKIQAKIDKQFEDTRKLLFKFVDPAVTARLEAELKGGRAADPAQGTAQATPQAPPGGAPASSDPRAAGASGSQPPVPPSSPTSGAPSSPATGPPNSPPSGQAGTPGSGPPSTPPNAPPSQPPTTPPNAGGGAVAPGGTPPPPRPNVSSPVSAGGGNGQAGVNPAGAGGATAPPPVAPR